MTSEELEKIVKSNQLSLARIEGILAKISKQMLWARVGGILKVILILAPIIIGIMYLSPFIKQYSGSFGSIFNSLKLYTGGYDDLPNERPNNAAGTDNTPALSPDLMRDFCDAEKREIYVRNICQ